MKNLYLFLAVIGAVIPMTQLIPWIQSEGLNLAGSITALFASLPAAGFTLDLLITSLTFWLFIYVEIKTLSAKFIGLVLVNLLIGLSCAFPLFLYLRTAKDI